MTRDRYVLVVLLVYVTLDLSLPAMPGAFAFDPAESVESARMNRGRAVGDVVPLAAPLPSTFAVAPLLHDRNASRPARQTGWTAHEVVSRLPRAALTPAPPSEDPQ